MHEMLGLENEWTSEMHNQSKVSCAQGWHTKMKTRREDAMCLRFTDHNLQCDELGTSF